MNLKLPKYYKIRTFIILIHSYLQLQLQLIIAFLRPGGQNCLVSN